MKYHKSPNSPFIHLIGLLLIMSLINSPLSNSLAYDNTHEVALNYCVDNRFKLTTGKYTVEFNENTKNKIIISHPSAWGVLGLCLVGDNPTSNLLNSFSGISSSSDGNLITIDITGKKSWSDYKLTLYAYKDKPGLLRWVLKLKKKPQGVLSRITNLMPFRLSTDRELQPLYNPNWGFYPVEPSEFITGGYPSILHARQLHFAAPIIYMSSLEWWYGTLFYFEDLTSLNKMFEVTKTGAEKYMVDISTSKTTFGYEIPAKILRRLPTGNEITVADSYLYLLERWPVFEADLALIFFHSLSTIYDLINKPETELTDWQELAKREIIDLEHPSVWVNIEGRPYLRAYVADKRTSAELISQLDVLLALKKYNIEYGGFQSLVDRLMTALPSFYSDEYKSITNNFPSTEKGDSWYLVAEMTQLAKLAKLGEPVAKELLFKSLESMMTFAHNVNYDFPVFFSFKTLQASSGTEPDVCGGYAYLMLDLYDLTKDKRYIDEAKSAIENIRGKAFNLNYEMQITAMTAVAAARLYKLTGDLSYLDMSYMPLANIMQVCWLWECDYGYGKSYSTFFGMSPMRYAGVITMKEQYETWIYLIEYLCLVGEDIPDYVEKLLSEFCKYTLFTLKYSLPPLIPQEAIEIRPHEWDGVDENIPSLYFPFEDLREGRSKSGQIGQELYGSGGPITFAAEAYVEIRPGVRIYSEYPIVWHNKSSFTLAGIPSYTCWVEIVTNENIKILDRESAQVGLKVINKNKSIFKAKGGETYKILTIR